MQSQINLVISQVACVPSADLSQPGHQHGDMYALCNLKSTWQSLWWHVCQMQSQINLTISMVTRMPNSDEINLAISLVAWVPNADTDQPGHQHGGMYAQFRLKLIWQSALWVLFPVQTQINPVISMVACMPNSDSN